MTRREFLALALSSLAAGCATRTATRHGSTRANNARPNIIFILTDDQGPWAWSGGGHPDARTPHLDRIAKEGAVLENYFCTSAVCSPTRAGLLTGLYPTENGITDWLPEGKSADFGLDPALPTWPAVLDRAGYHTALIGKWHVGEGPSHLPTGFGYDVFQGWPHGAHTSKDPLITFDGVVQRVEGYTSDILGDLAIDFIRAPHDGPFMLSLHFWAPHANTVEKTPDGDRTWHPLSDEDWNQYKDLKPTLPEPDYPDLDVPRTERMTREYLASVASVDRNVGRILAVLDELGLSDHTLVIFTSDHGYNLGHHGIWHKGNGRWLLKSNRGGRPNLWDTTLRAPAIIRWPGHVAPGAVVSQTVTNLDWFPTLVAVAGESMPPETHCHGRDILPLLRGETPTWNNDLFVQYDPQEGGDTQGKLRAYRTPEWKLVRDFENSGPDELYDLTVDPGEHRNLIGSDESGTVQAREKLEILMHRAMERISDPVLGQ